MKTPSMREHMLTKPPFRRYHSASVALDSFGKGYGRTLSECGACSGNDTLVTYTNSAVSERPPRSAPSQRQAQDSAQ